MRPLLTILLCCLLVPQPAAPQAAKRLSPSTRLDTILPRGSAHEYVFELGRGSSVALTVDQRGVDLVVEILDDRDSVLQVLDSPNGRNGPELVEIFPLRRTRYRIRIRPFDSREPEGRYSLAITAWRDARATSQLLATRKGARDSASAWLRAHGARLDSTLAPFEKLVRRVTVVGIGEATHGSREFGDLRLRLTRHLVERLGYRVVALEGSASRLALLDRYTRGRIANRDSVTRVLEFGWIGRRTLRDLVAWVRQWNDAHPADLVHLVGLDPQDNELARRDLYRLIAAAYPEALERYRVIEGELAVADSQTWVFGNSGVDSSARHFLQQMNTRLAADVPLLRRQFDSSLVGAGVEAARLLFQFADFNVRERDGWPRSRDWHMTTNLLGALERLPGTKAVYWAHNAHVAAPLDRTAGARPMGAWLRATLGCGYGAVAVTFDAGGFVAQIPNDPEDDLAVSELPSAPDETIEGVLRAARSGPSIASWGCEERTMTPSWLQQPQRMHWVGVNRPGTDPSEAFRSYRLTHEFDGVVFFPRVSADDVPSDRPPIPPRQRP